MLSEGVTLTKPFGNGNGSTKVCTSGHNVYSIYTVHKVLYNRLLMLVMALSSMHRGITVAAQIGSAPYCFFNAQRTLNYSFFGSLTRIPLKQPNRPISQRFIYCSLCSCCPFCQPWRHVMWLPTIRDILLNKFYTGENLVNTKPHEIVQLYGIQYVNIIAYT